MNRQKILAIRIANIEQVLALRRLEVAFLLLAAYRAHAKCDIESSESLAALDQMQLSPGLFDDDFVGNGEFACLQSRLPKQHNS